MTTKRRRWSDTASESRRRRWSDTPSESRKDWITSSEVAKALNMTDAAIRRWAREGLIEAIKTPGGQYRFRRDAVLNVLKGTHVLKRTKHKSTPKRRRRVR